MYVPIHVHTFWSLQDSTVAISKLADKAKEFGIPAICITDHMNLKGAALFEQKMNKAGVRPIIGVEIDLRNSLGKNTRITLIAKNKTGYKSLLELIYVANKKSDGLYCTVEDLETYRSGLICLIGDIFSPISFNIIKEWDIAYKANNTDLVEAYIVDNWKELGVSIVERFQKIYGDNVYIFADSGDLPMQQVVRKYNYLISKAAGVEFFPCNNIHAIEKSDDTLMALEIVLKASVEKINTKGAMITEFKDFRSILSSEPNIHLSENMDHFFIEGEQFSLEQKHNSIKLLQMIEKFEIREKPMLPKFRIKGSVIDDSNKKLREICREGYVSTGTMDKIKSNPKLKEIYSERINRELDIVQEADIAGYFLIVQDIIQFAKRCGIPVDIRGSATGCMISYLSGISGMDPLNPDPTLEYAKSRELPFERFYNKGRNSEDHVSLPDIDIDFPKAFRPKVVEYCKQKYGKDCVGHIITHTRYKAKAAIKELFKLSKPSIDYFEISNEITKIMIDEAKISDELAEIQEIDPDYGIIQWNIDNIPDIQAAYEEYPWIFNMAIQLEQIPRNESVHAAGVIIADRPLHNLFPMRYLEKYGDFVVDTEGTEVEYLGGVKFDFLGLAAMEKMYQITQMVNYKKFEVEYGIDRDFTEMMVQ